MKGKTYSFIEIVFLTCVGFFFNKTFLRLWSLNILSQMEYTMFLYLFLMKKNPKIGNDTIQHLNLCKCSILRHGQGC